MIAIPFLKYINEFEHIRKHTLYAGVITSAFVVISIIGVITAFGPLRSANIFYAKLSIFVSITWIFSRKRLRKNVFSHI